MVERNSIIIKFSKIKIWMGVKHKKIPYDTYSSDLSFLYGFFIIC